MRFGKHEEMAVLKSYATVRLPTCRILQSHTMKLSILIGRLICLTRSWQTHAEYLSILPKNQENQKCEIVWERRETCIFAVFCIRMWIIIIFFVNRREWKSVYIEVPNQYDCWSGCKKISSLEIFRLVDRLGQFDQVW